MSYQRKLINYTITCVNVFADRFNMSVKERYPIRGCLFFINYIKGELPIVLCDYACRTDKSRKRNPGWSNGTIGFLFLLICFW